MKLGVIYPQTELHGDPQAVRRIGLEVEALGFEHLLAYDHVLGAPHDREPKLWGPYTEHHPFHDPFMMFSHLAGLTEKLAFVTGILILPQRQTALVARQAADLALLSGGRFRMGVGIGWNYVEYDALGEDFHTRGKRLDEQLGLLRRLWSGELVSFEGQFDRIDRAALNPVPAQKIPVWIGGFVDAALRRAATEGDGFIFVAGVHDPFEGAAKLKTYLREAGRADEGFGMHCNMLQAKTPEAVVEMAARWRDAGGTHASINTMGQGFSGTEAHLDFIRRCAAALNMAGLI